MARVLRKVNCCSSPIRMSLLFYLLCFMKVAGKPEWKSTTPHASPTVTYNVLQVSKPRPKSSDQSFPHHRFASDVEVAAARNTSQNVTARAKIVHRNAVSSPINATRVELMLETMRRDDARVSSIQKQINQKVRNHKLQSSQKTPSQDFESTVSSGLSFGTGEYYAVLGVGTPHRDVYLVVDTGSDITWLQCAPCTNCYKQLNAVFEPSSSSTYKILHCDAALCLTLNVMGCLTNKCLYEVQYGDDSFTKGELATDDVVMDGATGPGEVLISDIPIGCGHDNEGTFGMAAGILGLGRGPLSFANHVYGDGTLGAVFSYCLPDREGNTNRHSFLIFGDAAVPNNAPGDVKFTPQLRNPRVATYYYIQITGISIGGNVLSTIPASAFELDFHGNGGTIIDSGTTITRLQTAAYIPARDAFRDATQHLKSAAEFMFLDTCYDLTGMESVSVPTVTFHFLGDYDMRLPPSNYIIPVGNNNTYCFAFAANAGPSIIGNVQQQGFRVIYDNVHQKIGFFPGQC